MKKLFLSVGLVGLVLVLVISGTALAQGDVTPTPAPQAPSERGMGGMGRGLGKNLGGQVGLEAAAKVLGMTADELSTQLWGGKTLADLAKEAGVDLQKVRDAVEAARLAAVKDAIEQAVTDGKLSREQADWMLQGLDKGYWGGGHGLGGCMGGFGGRGGMRGGKFGEPRNAPATSDQTSF